MEKFYKHLPETPGIYIMKGLKGKVLYIGKAGNLKRRASSYFLRPQEARLQRLVQEVRRVDYKKTDTALEALILESQLIKKYRPPYNVREKDDTSFWFVVITKDVFPRVLAVRGKELAREKNIRVSYGPFVEAGSVKEALRLIRRIFPYNTHQMAGLRNPPGELSTDVLGRGSKKEGRGCFNWQIGLCPGVCLPPDEAGTSVLTKQEYAKTVRNIRMIFEGKRKRLQKTLEKEMREAAKQEEFEMAEKKKRQIFALNHINDMALIRKAEDGADGEGIRVEGYDISNISGTNAVGSMVIFVNGKPSKSEYKKFKIRTIRGSNDVGMLREVLRRRLRHSEWPLPTLILIDGGKPQVNAAKEVLAEFGVALPVVGIAKGAKRKKNEFIGVVPKHVPEKTLIHVRDEAHRFAIKYHRELRGRL